LVLPTEPVSPELVLVDPELARRERARLEERAYLQDVLEHSAAVLPVGRELPPVLAVDLPARPAWRDAATFAKRRIVPAALLCSLLANGFLVAELVAHRKQEATQVAVKVVTVTSSVPEPTVGPTPTISRALTAKASVEQKVVSLILAAPAQKLPRDFIDPRTGLVRNNVQVVCRKAKARSFLCAVRLGSGQAHKPLYVRYRMHSNGKGLFTWYGRSVKGIRSS
jgi:hypothetical protein